MRIIQIIKRIIKELIRDKRTLVMIFLAPVFIMWLVSVVFSTNSSTNVDIGTVNVNNQIITELRDTKHVKIHKYNSKNDAQSGMKQNKIYAFVQQDGNRLDATYANDDANKTGISKMGIQNSLTKNTIKNLSSKISQLPTVVSKPQPLANNRVKSSQSSAIKVHNHYDYGNSKTDYFSTIMPILIGFFVFLFVFLISGMSLLKERTSGTLSRLLATPVKRSEIILGYLGSYGILSVLQTIVIVTVTVGLLHVEIVGSIFSVIIINILVALVALTAGLLISTLAESEFQMVQFIPLIAVPQLFLSGLIPLDSLPKWLNIISYIFPLRYAADAQSAIIFSGKGLSSVWMDIIILIGFTVILLILNVAGLRRYRKV